MKYTSTEFRKLLRGLPGLHPFIYGFLLNRYFIAHQVEWRALNKCKHYVAGGVMADIGCGDQPYRHLFKQVTTFYGVDKSADSKADVIADVHEIPFKDSTLDALLATEILEHVSDPSKVMGEISRVLKPNGVLLLTVPFFWGLHQEPFDYYRYTKYGLQYLSEKNGLEVLEVVPKCGFWATWTQRLIDNVIEVYMRNCSAWSTYTVTALFAPVSAGGYLLDSLIGCRGDSLGNTLVARKPPSARPEKV